VRCVVQAEHRDADDEVHHEIFGRRNHEASARVEEKGFAAETLRDDA
jgi:hypothetical protein